MYKLITINVAPSGQAPHDVPAMLYVPDNLLSAEKVPLIVFGHGRDEAGTDGTKIYNNGLPAVIKSGFIPPWKCIILAPQHSSYSVDPAWLQPILDNINFFASWDGFGLITTGISAGGWLSWGSIFNVDIATAKKVIATICLSAMTNDLTWANLPRIKDLKTPILSISGSTDPTAPIAGQQDTANTINAQLPGSVDFQIRTGIGHTGWIDIYKGAYTWVENGVTMDFWKWAKAKLDAAVAALPSSPGPVTNPTPVAQPPITQPIISVPPPTKKIISTILIKNYDDGSTDIIPEGLNLYTITPSV